MVAAVKAHSDRIGELTEAFDQAAADQAEAIMELVRELAAENEDLTKRVEQLENAMDRRRD